MGLSELARAVAIVASGDGGPEESTVDRVALVLHHQHLPKLDDHGLLEYDREANRIESVGGIESRPP